MRRWGARTSLGVCLSFVFCASGAQESVGFFDSSSKKQTNKIWVCLTVLLGTFKYLREIKNIYIHIHVLYIDLLILAPFCEECS